MLRRCWLKTYDSLDVATSPSVTVTEDVASSREENNDNWNSPWLSSCSEDCSKNPEEGETANDGEGWTKRRTVKVVAR